MCMCVWFCVLQLHCKEWHDILWTQVSHCSRMRSKGSRFTLGVWGLSCVPQTLLRRPQLSTTNRNRPQPSATVRKCPREVAMAVPMVSSVTFGAFQCRIASFRVGLVALCDISTSFKSRFCVAGAILLPHFQRMRCMFRGRSNFGDLQCHFAWQAQHFGRVVLRVFCEPRCQCCAQW